MPGVEPVGDDVLRLADGRRGGSPPPASAPSGAVEDGHRGVGGRPRRRRRPAAPSTAPRRRTRDTASSPGRRSDEPQTVPGAHQGAAVDRCGRQVGAQMRARARATSSAPSSPRHATSCTPADRGAERPSCAICELAANAYQLPLGPALRAGQRRRGSPRAAHPDRSASAPTSPSAEAPGTARLWRALCRNRRRSSPCLRPAASRRSSAERPGWARCAGRARPARSRRAAGWPPSSRWSRRVPSRPPAGRCGSRHPPAPPATRVSCTPGRSAKSPGAKRGQSSRRSSVRRRSSRRRSPGTARACAPSAASRTLVVGDVGHRVGVQFDHGTACAGGPFARPRVRSAPAR